MVKTMHANELKNGELNLVNFEPSDEYYLFETVDMNTNRPSLDEFRNLIKEFLESGKRWMAIDSNAYFILTDTASKRDKTKVVNNRGHVKGILLDILQIDKIDNVRIHKWNKKLGNGTILYTLVFERVYS